MAKKAKSRVLMFLFAMAFVLVGVISYPSYTKAEVKEGEANGYSFKYDTATNTASISGYTGADSILVIPSSVEADGVSYTVTGIDEFAFCYNETITEITIPDSVTEIGSRAFRWSSLEKVNIPSSITKINDYAFGGTKITSITIPASVTEIGEGAFDGCSDLTTVTFAKGIKLTTIGDRAFAFNEKLSSISLPETVSKIGKQAFASCYSLKKVSIPKKVTKIEYATYADCNGLKSVEIPKNVKSIGDIAFYNCKNLSTVTVNNPSATISKYAIGYNADGKEKVTVSENWVSPARVVDNFVIKSSDNKSSNTSLKYAKGNGITYYYGKKYVLAGPASVATSVKTGVTVSWSKVKNAKSYTVYKKNSKGKWDKLATTDKTSYTDKKATKDGTLYEYKVTCTDKVVKKDAEGNTVSFYKLNPVKATSATSTSYRYDETTNQYIMGKMTVVFSGNKYADGYEIEDYSDKSFSNMNFVIPYDVKKSGETIEGWFSHSDWNPHTYIRIRPYKKKGNQISYGMYSNIIEVGFID